MMTTKCPPWDHEHRQRGERFTRETDVLVRDHVRTRQVDVGVTGQVEVKTVLYGRPTSWIDTRAEIEFYSPHHFTATQAREVAAALLAAADELDQLPEVDEIEECDTLYRDLSSGTTTTVPPLRPRPGRC